MSDVKVTLGPTPTEQIVAKATAAVVVSDGRGRKIRLSRPGVLAQFRLVEALGDVAENRVYMRMVLPLIYVADIDGDAVIPATRKSEVEALIKRLDEDGIEAVMAGVAANFGAVEPEAARDGIKK